MIQFSSLATSISSDRVTLSADPTIIFDSANQETYLPGYPLLWDEFVLSKIVIEDYDVFHFFAHIIPKNERSRITDYKKVWGLSDIPKGTSDLMYSTDSQTVYLGITRAHGEKGFRENGSSLLFLLPKETQLDSCFFLELFAQRGCRFSVHEISNVVSDMCQHVPNAIGLWYSVKESARLTIFRKNIDSVFSDKEFWAFKEAYGDMCAAYRPLFCNLFI